MSARPSKRKVNEMRAVEIIPGFMDQAHGSCLIKLGGTHVICTATIEDKVPPFLRNTGKGWVTAEYGMLPCSTGERVDREAARGKQSGRTQEIQRLIGRSLRAVTDLSGFGERQIRIDCDVLRADGGTRTASITGAYVALFHAFGVVMERERKAKNPTIKKDKIGVIPLKHQVAAISCGVYQGNVVLDLDYLEDSSAEADANFVMTADGRLIEVQGTAEQDPFSKDDLSEMLSFAESGIQQLVKAQLKATTLWNLHETG